MNKTNLFEKFLILSDPRKETKIALNLLKKNKGKDSVNLAQMKSLMNDEYREKLIFG